MDRASKLKEIKDDLYEVVTWEVALSDYEDGGCLADEIFDEVASLLRRRFGLSLNEADALLADVKASAVRTLGDAVNNLVDLPGVIDAIADHLNEEAAA